MNKNKFEYRGKTYIAVRDDDNSGCDKCAFAFDDIECATLQIRGEFPPCVAQAREDGKNVHFVEKGNEEQK